MRYTNKQAALDDATYFEDYARRCDEKAEEYRRLAERIRKVAERLELEDAWWYRNDFEQQRK